MTGGAKGSPLPIDPSQPARPRSRLAVAVGTLLMLFVFGVCVVCGGGVYLFQPEVSEDPDRVAPLTAEMLRVEVPAAFDPRGTIEWDFFWLVLMRGVYYELTADDGTLMFLQVDSRLMAEQDVRDHVERTLREKGGGGPPLAITEAEERIYVIRGSNVPFSYRVGVSPADQSKHHLVEGIVDGDSGKVLVAFRITDESWAENEPLVTQVIESIR